MDLESLRKHFLGVVVVNAGDHHARSTLLPVHWGCYLLRGSQLKRVNHAKNLVKVSSGRSRIQDGEFEFLVRSGKGPMVKCCLLYTSPSPRDRQKSRMPSSA